jgi:hypothetical protein
MKLKHISALIVLVLIAFTSVSTVIAQIGDYNPPSIVNKKGKVFTFTILTSEGDPAFDGGDVPKSSIVITIYEKKGKTITEIIMTDLDPNIIDLQQDTITITMLWQEVPKHCDSYHITGTVGAVETFYATGPAWGWGGFHAR